MGQERPQNGEPRVSRLSAARRRVGGRLPRLLVAACTRHSQTIHRPQHAEPAGAEAFNATCSEVGNHISCSLAFTDPDIVDAPSGIVCAGTELLLTQSRSVVGTRLYNAGGNLLRRHFRESLDGTFTNPNTGLVALWAQHDTVIHTLTVPGDDTSGTEHISGLDTRAWLPGGGTIFTDAGTMTTNTAGDVATASGHHPLLDFLVSGDTSALDPLCAALD